MVWWNRRRRRRHETTDNDDEPSFDFPRIVLRSAPPSSRGSERGVPPGSSSDTSAAAVASESTGLPLLYSLARSWAWQAVLFRCETHPHEASVAYVDHHGDNVLHWTVFGRPDARVVEQLLKACPELAQRRNKQGNFPLHVASSYRASQSVILPLLQAYPEAAGLPNASGSYVLHLLCDYGTTPGILHQVLRTQQAVASVLREDRIYRRRPLHIIRRNLRTGQRTRDTIRDIRGKLRTLQTAGAERHQDEMRRLEQELIEFEQDDFWRKVSLLLVAEATQSPLAADGVDPIDVLQAAIQIEDCPASFQEHAILLYSEILTQPRESDHCVPLHVAAERGNTALLLDLVEACPQAATVRNARGHLPLQTALLLAQRRGQYAWRWGDGLGALIEANPAALEELRLPDTVYPLIWGRLSTRESLFHAIRSFPRPFGSH